MNPMKRFLETIDETWQIHAGTYRLGVQNQHAILRVSPTPRASREANSHPESSEYPAR
jgi:hypothetical protein